MGSVKEEGAINLSTEPTGHNDTRLSPLVTTNGNMDSQVYCSLPLLCYSHFLNSRIKCSKTYSSLVIKKLQ